MRKKTIVSVLLSALILVMPLSSCDKKNDGTKTPSAKNPITETISEVEGPQIVKPNATLFSNIH